LNIQRLPRSVRLLVLVVFFASFAALLLIPVNFSDWSLGKNPSLIQSLYVLPLDEFFVLYLSCNISGVIGGLMLKKPEWKALVLILLAISTSGFWVIHSPLGNYEDINKLVNNAVIREYGQILPSGGYGTYSDFPGLFITGWSFSSLTGFNGTTLFLPLLSVSISLVALEIFLISRRLLRTNTLAFLSGYVALVGNVLLPEFQYHPDFMTISLVLTLIFLWTLPRSKKLNTFVAILSSAIITSDFSASVVLLFLLLAASLLSSLLANAHQSIIKNIAIMYIVMLGIWSVYWSSRTTGSLLGSVLLNFRDLIGVTRVQQLYSANVAVPIWASLVRIGWLILLVGIPLVLLPLAVFRKKSLPAVATLFISSIVVGMISVLGQGGVNIFITVLYAPFAGSLILFSFVARSRTLILAVLCLSFLLVVPSFLASSDRILTYTYPIQYFVSAQYTDQYSTSASATFTIDSAILYYKPSKIQVVPSDLLMLPPLNQSSIYSMARLYFDSFSSRQGSLLLLTPNFFDNYYHLYGQVTGRIVETSAQAYFANQNLVYSDGYSILYAHS
jgi:hypothetical protein